MLSSPPSVLCRRRDSRLSASADFPNDRSDQEQADDEAGQVAQADDGFGHVGGVRNSRQHAPLRPRSVPIQHVPSRSEAGRPKGMVCGFSMKVSYRLIFVGKTLYRDLWDGLLAEGSTVVTTHDIVQRSGSTIGATRVAVAEAIRRHFLFSPVRGLYVVVPPEYRSWGVVPADWFVADLCAHLGRLYYEAYLSAAARHGASHQAAQLYQVVVNRKIGAREVNGLRMRFYQASHFDDRPTTTFMGPNGQVVVATAETTALDLAEHPDRGGGLDNVTTVLKELPLDPGVLSTAAGTRRPATVRRLGYLLELACQETSWDSLLRLARPGTGSATLLHPKGGSTGPLDGRWNLQLNTPVEPEQ